MKSDALSGMLFHRQYYQLETCSVNTNEREGTWTSRYLGETEEKYGIQRYFYSAINQLVRFCGLVVRVPGYITEMYCDSCEVRTVFIYVM
jgi:hypothetical protein